MKVPGANASYDRGEILRMAEKYRSQRRIRKATREYETILSVDPRDVDVHIRIAPLYIRAGRKEQAKSSLRQVIAGYEKQGFVDKAIASLRLALTVDRRDLVPHLRLALPAIPVHPSRGVQAREEGMTLPASRCSGRRCKECASGSLDGPAGRSRTVT